MNPRRLPAAALVVLIVVLAIVWYLRPVFHPLAMFLYTAPLVWFPALMVLVVGGGAVLATNRRSGGTGGNRFRDPFGGGWEFGDGEFKRLPQISVPRGAGQLTAVAIVSFIVFIVGSMLNGPLTAQSLYDSTDYEIIDQLPAIGSVRIVPQEVAVRIAESGFNSPTERLTDFHVVRTRENGQTGLAWNALRSPSGAYRALTKKSEGMLSLDAARTERTVEQVDATFESAPGMYITDNLRWRMLKKHYFLNITEMTPVRGADGKPVIVAPYIKYKGWLIRRPVFGGVFVAHADGRIEDLTPGEAVRRPELLETGRLFPPALARRIQDAYAYKNGLWNKWFVHEDQTSIADTESNPQPYFTDYAKSGTKWVSLAEPFGRAFAASGVFLTDGVTGKTQLWRPTRDAGLTGNRRSLETVRSLSIPGVNFADTKTNAPGSRGTFRVVEPRPVTIDGRLVYLISIIPDAANSVSKTVFIDAARNKAVAIFDNDNDPQADEKIAEFVRSGDAAGAAADPSDATAADDSGATGDTAGAKVDRPARGNDESPHKRLDRLIDRQRELLKEFEQLRNDLR